MWQYISGVISLGLIYVIATVGLAVFTGFTGLFSLGHAAFFAIGAYTAAILTSFYGVNFYVALAAGAAAGGLVGFLIGYPTLKAKLRTDYFAIATLGFGEAVRLLLQRIKDPALPPQRLVQVHGRAVVEASGELQRADGLWTCAPGLAIGVQVADCVPVLLAGPVQGRPWAAALHAGWRGAVAGILRQGVQVFTGLGGRPGGGGDGDALGSLGSCGRQRGGAEHHGKDQDKNGGGVFDH